MIALLIVALAVPTLPAEAAQVKPGARCSTLNEMDVARGKVYTCVRKGKKLVWNGGRTIPKPVATPTVAPFTPPKAPTSFDDLIDNYKGIRYAAWEKSREKLLNSEPVKPELEFVVGPNSSVLSRSSLFYFDQVARLYAGYVRPSKVKYLTFNYADRDWATNQMELIMPNKGSGWINDFVCPRSERCWGGGAFSDGSDNFLIVIGAGTQIPDHVDGTLDAHEFTHVVQQSLMRAGNPWPLYDPWPPTWYWEGQGTFTQNAAVWIDSFDTYEKYRNERLRDVLRDPLYDAKLVQEFFVINGNDQWRKSHNFGRNYDLGSMFVEILVALRGPDSTMEVWKLAQTGKGFATAFETVYGISFEKALPIMSKAIALQLGR